MDFYEIIRTGYGRKNKQLPERAESSARFRYEVNDIEKAIRKNDRQLQ